MIASSALQTIGSFGKPSVAKAIGTSFTPGMVHGHDFDARRLAGAWANVQRAGQAAALFGTSTMSGAVKEWMAR
jgi:hypothetical protein